MKPRFYTTTPDTHGPAKRRVGPPDSEAQPVEDRGRTAEKPSEIPKQGWRDILGRTKERVKNDNLSIVAAGVAFYIFLGLIPALGAAISIYGLAADPVAIRNQLSSLRGTLPQEVITILNDQMMRISHQSAGATRLLGRSSG